jgi:hypothetical protein
VLPAAIIVHLLLAEPLDRLSLACVTPAERELTVSMGPFAMNNPPLAIGRGRGLRSGLSAGFPICSWAGVR